MFPISACDFPGEPAEGSYGGRASSGGTACTVRNNVPKKPRRQKSKTVFYGAITLSKRRGWEGSGVVNPV